MSLTLSPYALTTVARLKSHLVRSTAGESDVTDRCIGAINSATAWMERRTGRKLKARNWRTSFMTAFNTTINDATMTPADITLLYEGDDVVLESGEDACIPAGSQIDSVGATTVELSQNCTATVVQAGARVGSQPLRVDGNGTNVLYLPEWPLVTFWAAYSVDSAGNRSALNYTSARVDEMGGRLELPYDVFPEGEQNIELECRAGYQDATAYRLGHSVEWAALERLCLRISEIFYSDDLSLRGRNSDISMGGVSSRVNEFDMPADVREAIWPFVRTR